jgi:hypothetical protein
MARLSVFPRRLGVRSLTLLLSLGGASGLPFAPPRLASAFVGAGAGADATHTARNGTKEKERGKGKEKNRERDKDKDKEKTAKTETSGPPRVPLGGPLATPAAAAATGPVRVAATPPAAPPAPAAVPGSGAAAAKPPAPPVTATPTPPGLAPARLRTATPSATPSSSTSAPPIRSAPAAVKPPTVATSVSAAATVPPAPRPVTATPAAAPATASTQAKPSAPPAALVPPPAPVPPPPVAPRTAPVPPPAPVAPIVPITPVVTAAPPTPVTPARSPAEAANPSGMTTATVPQSVPTPAEAPPPPGPVTFIEHLGPEAFPDRTRGLQGGSLWLEPSFHGLQWPYMPRSGVGVSGYVWADTSRETINRGDASLPNTSEWLHQARAVVRVTPTYARDGLFVQGQVELVGSNQQGQASAPTSSNPSPIGVDDLWVRVGVWNRWDLKVGRFEGWELYHTGMGLDINTVERRGATQAGVTGAGPFERPDYYGVTYLHDRPNGQGIGNIAGHLYATDSLRFELLTQIGVSDYVAGGQNVLGARGAAIFDLGWLKLKAGGEYAHRTKSTDPVVSTMDTNGDTIQVKRTSKAVGSQRGLGGTAQIVWNSLFEAGVSGGVAFADQSDDDGNPIQTEGTTTYSIGVFGTVALGRLLLQGEDLLAGAGFNYTSRTDQNHVLLSDPTNPGGPQVDRVDFTANLQGFASLQYLVAHQLFVKAIVAYARSDFDLAQGAVYSNTMWSGRVRLMYLF